MHTRDLLKRWKLIAVDDSTTNVYVDLFYIVESHVHTSKLKTTLIHDTVTFGRVYRLILFNLFQVSDFFSRSDDLFNEMQWQKKLRRKKLYHSFITTNTV